MTNLAVYPAVKRRSDSFRTTLTLERELYEFVDTYARANALKFNEAVGRLVSSAKSLLTQKTSNHSIAQASVQKKGDQWVVNTQQLKRVAGGGVGARKVTHDEVKLALEEMV